MGSWFNYNVACFENILESIEGLVFRYDEDDESTILIDATDANKELIKQFIEELRQNEDSIYTLSVPLSDLALKENWNYTNGYVADMFESILQNYDKSQDYIALEWI
jgi:hypothetical protein